MLAVARLLDPTGLCSNLSRSVAIVAATGEETAAGAAKVINAGSNVTVKATTVAIAVLDCVGLRAEYYGRSLVWP